VKISYFSYLYDIKGVSAGSANKAIGLIGGLRAIGHDASIFWRSIQPENLEGSTIRHRVRDVLKKRSSRFVHDPRRLASNLKYIPQEVRILNEEQPDILFLRSELYNVSAMWAARRLNIPVVLEVDCPTVYEHRHMSGRDKVKLPFLPEAIERWNWRKSDAVIAISTILRDYLVKEGVPTDKITVIPNGADPQTFKPGVGGRDVRSALKLSNKVVIGWVGSLFGWSGLENLLVMSQKILKLRDDVAFLFVGGGKNREVMEQTFRPGDIGTRVHLTGTVPYEAVPRYIDAMDIVLAPYPKLPFWYPSSMKVFEYMSAEKAVVASAVGQIAEVIRDGENGCLFDPDVLDGLLERVLSLVDNPSSRERMARKARQTVLAHYTWEGHARTLEQIFKSVLAKR